MTLMVTGEFAPTKQQKHHPIYQNFESEFLLKRGIYLNLFGTDWLRTLHFRYIYCVIFVDRALPSELPLLEI